MKIDTFQCDVCKTQKKEANHWFKGYKFLLGGLAIHRWDDTPTGDDVENFEAHLCGADCLTQWISKNFLNAGAQ